MTRDSVLSVQVLLPVPLSHPYTYRVPEDSPIPSIGQIVQVPFGHRTIVGVVWEGKPPSTPLPELKTLDAIAPDCLPPRLLTFIERMAAYTLAPLGSVLKMVLGRAAETLFQTPKRRLKSLEAHPIPGKAPTLSPEQQDAASLLVEAVDDGTFTPLVLEGLTGSGKTEVYCEAVDRALKAGKQVLVLLPEIALTSQMLKRFEARFGFAPAVWHADVPETRRKSIWRSVLRGENKVVLGARSALFLPSPNLGLIVVDEEHEGAYKQEEGAVRYQGRDMAVLKASIERIPIILSSATPSLETLWNVEQNRYRRVRLNQRFQAALPRLEVIPLKRTGEAISPRLRQALEATFERGEQSLLFLNRRGYAPVILCQACGHVATCPDCNQGLVFHQKMRGLLCHFCGQSRSPAAPCQKCGKSEPAVFQGMGVEKLAEEVAALFPSARVGVMSSDHMTSPKKLEGLIRDLEARTIDVLVGTQMVAKGHHFPGLTCVGVIDGDGGSQSLDFRAPERTYQMLTQVAGRAGRAQALGDVFIQTHTPESPLLKAFLKQSREAWVGDELAEREHHGWPPYGRLAALILSGPDASKVQAHALALARKAPVHQDIRVLGPIPAPLFQVRRQYRWRFLIQGPRDIPLQPFLKTWLEGVSPPPQGRLHIDVDPYGFD